MLLGEVCMKKSDVDSIRVKDPCNESWDEMTGNDRVRFCTHCAKEVNNISELTRKEVARLVRESGGRLCVRYRTDPKTKAPMFADRVVAFARHGAAAGVLGASLLGVNAVYAQGAAMPQLVQIERVEKTGVATAKISGYVTDPNGAAIPYAIVALTNLETMMSFVQNASGEGFYEFKDLEAGKYKLRFEAGGFNFREFDDIYLGDASELRRDGNLSLLHVAETVEVRGSRESQTFTTGIIVGDIEMVPGNELVEAVLDEDFENVKARVMMRAKINVRDKSRDGMTPLHAAVQMGNIEIAEYLLNHGAKTNIRDSFKRTPLMMMNEDASPELFDLLVRHGAKLTLLDKEKNNLLHHYAKNNGSPDLIRHLIIAGVGVNAVDKEGHTPLMLAVVYSTVDSVRAMIESGADVNAVAKNGKSAVDMTEDNLEVRSLLETYGAIARSR
jgi:hypothetical protein